MLAVLVPLMLILAAGIRRKQDHVGAAVAALPTELTTIQRELGNGRADVIALRAELNETRDDLNEARRDLHTQGERVARIEGAVTSPWFPPKNGPQPSGSPPG